MKHNTWISTLTSRITGLGMMAIVIIVSLQAEAKIVKSEFLNQSIYGSEGPQLLELELEGNKSYLLNYNLPGKEPLSKPVTHSEYLKLQNEMKKFLPIAMDRAAACERELTYTKVEHEKDMVQSTVCWQELTSTQRVQLSQWLIGLQKRLTTTKTNQVKKVSKLSKTSKFSKSNKVKTISKI